MHITQRITLSTQLCLVLYSFCANLQHSLVWLMVLSLSPHSLHLLFCYVLSILALIWLVLMALFCAAIWGDSVSLLKFSFFSHVHVFLCEMFFISRLKYPWSCFSSQFCFLVIVILLVFVFSIVSDGCNPPLIFLCSLRYIVSMRQSCLQCWQFLFLPLFLIHIVS